MALSSLEAEGILGAENVVDKSDFVRAWGVAEAMFSPEVPHTPDTLAECARQNEKAETQWKLVYFWGFSLAELRQRIGIDPSLPLSFHANCGWWLEEEWSHVAPPGGFYLLDFRPRLEFRKSESSLAVPQGDQVLIDPRCRRPHESVVIESAITITRMTGEWPLKGYFLCTSRTQDKGEEIVIACNDNKIEIWRWGLTLPREQLSTYRMWIPEEIPEAS